VIDKQAEPHPLKKPASRLFMDACKNNVRLILFLANAKKRFVSGHDFSRAANRR
jgi:hypothetical protein